MILHFGEAALLVQLPDTWRVHALAGGLRLDPLPGVVDTVPGIDTLLVEHDPLADTDALATGLARRIAALPTERDSISGRHRSLPVAYGGAYGPDLERVAAAAGLPPQEYARRHAASAVAVQILGFAPGFAYLGPLPSELAVPRLATPRTRTPRGSVGVAGNRTGVYPAELPGGWPIIGRTPVVLFDPAREPPAYLVPGDQVAFEPISLDSWPDVPVVPDDW